MGVIDSSPLTNVPAHNCVVWNLFYDGGSSYSGSQASASITFADGGTATLGTIIYFAGQAFSTDTGFGVNDGYNFNYNGLSGDDRAAAFLETLNANLFFSPDKVTLFISGDTVAITFNQVGEQSNWNFSDGGISEISFIEINGDNQVYDKNPKYIHALYRDMTDFGLADIKLCPEKEAAVILTKNYLDGTPAAETYVPTPVDYSNEMSNLVATHLPNIYGANWSPTGDFLFSLPVYLRAGYSFLVGCERRNIFSSKSDTIRIYNSLFQKEKYTAGADLMQSYVEGGALMLIKDRYQICRSTNFAVWTSYINYNNIEVVYYDASGTPLESVTNEFVVSNNVNYTNLGTFGSAPPANCDHYIVNFTNFDDEVLGAVRFDLINCACVDGELIFLSDLGAYETFLLMNNTRTELTVNSDTVQGFDGCNVFSLQQGGRSIVNKQTENIYTYETWVDTSDPKELEYVNQLLRSQSVFLKVFITEADAWFYVKIIPENTNFVPLETGKRAKLTYSFKFNQAYKSHPQYEAVFI
jgi:hypothetical protein